MHPGRSPARVHVGHAFGLQVEADWPVTGLLSGRPDGGGPRVAMRLVGSNDDIGLAWPRTGTDRLIDRRHADGSAFMTIDRHESAGYRVEAPGHGSHLVTPDGSSVTSAIALEPAWQWQKLLYAQTLPLAATLRGIELLHASAVQVAGAVSAFVGPSGMGKSSVATHCLGLGAAFFTDDVLALADSANGLLAFPGPRFANVHSHEVEALAEDSRHRLGRYLGSSDKQHFEPPGGVRLPLGGLYFLQRGAAQDGVHVERWSPDPRALLSSTFVAHVGSPERLLRQLSLCAAIAQKARVFRVRAPMQVEARRVAAAVMAHSTDPS